MSFLSKYKTASTKENSTKGISFGRSESEAEAVESAVIHLEDVFIQNESVFHDITHGKFIITGRKGCGKSAIANYLKIISEKEATLFCKFIKKNDIDFEKIIQFGSDESTTPDKAKILYQWIILYKLLELLVENERITHEKSVGFLKKFLRKNSNFTEFDTYKITEILKNDENTVQIDGLKKFFSLSMKESLSTKRERMSFAELIPYLKNVTTHLIQKIDSYADGSFYFIFFDDLDNDFKVENDNCKKSLLSLIRVTRDFNTILFQNNPNTTVNIVLLLRDDIQESLLDSADSAKIFASYSTPIEWFDEKTFKEHPDETLIKKFIDTRIKKAFSKTPMAERITKWEDFSSVQYKSVLDNTFYTPRDLILFFDPISKSDYNIPLSSEDIKSLNDSYCDSIVDELKNSLSIFYSSIEISKIFDILKKNLTTSDADYNFLKKAFEDEYIDGKTAINRLLDESILGLHASNGFTFFKHRQKKGEEISIGAGDSKTITLHNALKTYFFKHRLAPQNLG